MTTVSLIGAPTDVGASVRGAGMGPDALRVAGLGESLRARGFEVIDRGNLAGPPNPWRQPERGIRHLPEVVQWNRAVFEAVSHTPLTSGTAVTPMQSVIFGYTALAPVLTTFGFVLMCNERMRAELERLAATDALTGVLNRRMLEELVTGQLADARLQK